MQSLNQVVQHFGELVIALNMIVGVSVGNVCNLPSVVTFEGIGGLYKGFWPTIICDVPEIAIHVLFGKSQHHTLTFMLRMMSLHTKIYSHMGNDFLMHVWMLVFDLFHDMVDWEFCKGQLDLSPSLG
jgi:hypothetical protein